MYAKLYNDYGRNIRKRFVLFGDEMQRYAEERKKDLKVSRSVLEDLTSRGASQGMNGVFISQGYKGISPKIRQNARYKIVVVGFFSNDDRTELLHEMEISSKEEQTFASDLHFDPTTGQRECLLVDNWTKQYRKFYALSPLNFDLLIEEKKGLIQ